MLGNEREFIADYGTSPTIAANSIGAVVLIGDGLASVELIANEQHGQRVKATVVAHLVLPVCSLIPGAEQMVNASAIAGAITRKMS